MSEQVRLKPFFWGGRELDNNADVNEATGIQILSKLAKQRRESIKSYSDANRLDLAATEQAELETIESYLPKQMSPDEVLKLIEDTIAALGATTIKDMGSVMNSVRPQLLGKADMSTVGDIIKKKLSPSK